MPASLRALLAIREIQEPVLIYFLSLFGADDTDLVVASTKTSTSIDDRMDVQFRSLWFARELAQTLHKLLLEVIGDVVLLAEEDHTALRDCSLSGLHSTRRHDRRHTGDGKVSDEIVRIRRFQPVLQVDVDKLATDHWGDVEGLVLIENSLQL